MGDGCLEIRVRDENRLVEIWLTNAEKRDAGLRETLKPLYERYRAKKYLVAVFESGDRPLADAASDLLCYNRRRMAQRDAQR